MSFRYVASPYSDPDPAVRHRRFREAVTFITWAALRKIVVFSPVVHWHESGAGLPYDFQYWAELNDPMIERSDGIYILKTQGWDTSLGIAHERRLAFLKKLPIRFAQPHGEGDFLLEMPG